MRAAITTTSPAQLWCGDYGEVEMNFFSKVVKIFQSDTSNICFACSLPIAQEVARGGQIRDLCESCAAPVGVIAADCALLQTADTADAWLTAHGLDALDGVFVWPDGVAIAHSGPSAPHSRPIPGCWQRLFLVATKFRAGVRHEPADIRHKLFAEQMRAFWGGVCW